MSGGGEEDMPVLIYIYIYIYIYIFFFFFKKGGHQKVISGESINSSSDHICPLQPLLVPPPPTYFNDGFRQRFLLRLTCVLAPPHQGCCEHSTPERKLSLNTGPSTPNGRSLALWTQSGTFHFGWNSPHFNPLQFRDLKHLSILAWKTSWTEEPGWSMWLQRVRHD